MTAQKCRGKTLLGLLKCSHTSTKISLLTAGGKVLSGERFSFAFSMRGGIFLPMKKSSAELIKSRKSFTISVWRIYKPIRVFERQFWSCSSLKNWNPLPTHMGYLSDWALRASVMLIGQELWFVIFFFSFIIFCRLNVFFLPFLPAAGQAENILPNKDLIWQFVDGILVLPS